MHVCISILCLNLPCTLALYQNFSTLLALQLLSKVLNLFCINLTETASDDDTLDVSDDDFFMSGSSSDEEADDELTDKSAKYDSQLLDIVFASKFLEIYHAISLLLRALHRMNECLITVSSSIAKIAAYISY